MNLIKNLQLPWQYKGDRFSSKGKVERNNLSRNKLFYLKKGLQCLEKMKPLRELERKI